MLCVTISERIVRKTSRPMRTGRQTLTNASSPTNARSPTTSVAHGSRWPPPPKRTERPPQIPAPRNARRQRSSRSGPNCESAPIATTSSPTTVARGPSSHRPRRRSRGATTSEPSPRSTPSPIRAPAARAARQPSRPARAPERLGVEGFEERRVERAVGLVEPERGGERHASVETPARTEPAAGDAEAFCAAISCSTSFSVMNPRLSICRDRRRGAPRARPPSASPCGRRQASARASPRPSRPWPRARLRVSATYAIVLPSSTSTSSPYSCTIVPAPGASTSTVAFVVSTTQTGWPADTSERSSTSHSARRAYSVFASSRVRTISSTQPAPSSDMTVSTTSSTLGSISSSSGRADGMIPSRAAIRRTGARRSLHAASWTRAAISAPKPPVSVPSSAVTSAPVRATDSRTGVELHRDELGERDHLAEDLVLEDELRDGVQHDRNHPAVRDDRRRALREVGRGERERRIGAVRLAHRELADVPVLGPADRAPVEQLVLDEEHRPLVVDRRSRAARRRRGTRWPRRRRCSGSRAAASRATGCGSGRSRGARPSARARPAAPSPGRRTSRGTSRSRSRPGRGRAR